MKINYEAVVRDLELFLGLELYMHPADKEGSLERLLNHIDSLKQKHTLHTKPTLDEMIDKIDESNLHPSIDHEEECAPPHEEKKRYWIHHQESEYVEAVICCSVCYKTVEHCKCDREEVLNGAFPLIPVSKEEFEKLYPSIDNIEQHCCACEIGIEVNEQGDHVWGDGEYIARGYMPCTKRAVEAK